MIDVDFRLLGPLEVHAEGREVRLQRRQLRTLLLALLVETGRTVTSGRLVDVVWEDRVPASAAAALHTLVATLRQWLDAAIPSGHDLLRTRPGGYLLAVDREQVDAGRFERLAADGAAALRAHRADDAATLLDGALDLWRGPAFADVIGKEFVRAPAARLEELRRAAEEDRAEADLHRQRHGDAAGRLEALVVAEPLRERRWALYMTALYRMGRQHDALAAYRRVHGLLRDELGVDPGPELRRVHDAVLHHDPALLDGAKENRPSVPAARPAVRRRPLPESVSSFVGRAEEVAAVSRLLTSGRLVTLTGPGGVGKTRLAVAAARAMATWFPAGTAFVPLGGLRDPGGVIPAIATALGLRGDMASVSHEEIAERVRDERVLLVLDTLEHLLDARGDIAELLSSCGGLTVLATSRTPLSLVGERRYFVPPLALPEPGARDPDAVRRIDAVALFIDRATAVDPDFVLDEERTRAVVAWCRRLGGVPLALELAAARAGAHPEELYGRGPTLADLREGPFDAPERQRTMRATLDWSVNLLSQDARLLLARLSVFRGAADKDAVTAIGSETAGALDELIASGLVTRRKVSGEPRYVLLDVVAEYAAELLDEEDAAATARRHAQHFLARAERDRPPPGYSDTRTVEWLDDDAHDLRAALDELRRTDDLEAAARLVTALYRWWRDRGDAGEGRRATVAVLDDAAGRLDPALVGELGTCAGFLAAAQGDYDDAALHFQAALQAWERAGSTAGRARALYGLGGMRYRQGADENAVALLDEALEAARKSGEATVEGRTLAQLASVVEARGDWAEARRRYAEAEALAHARGRAYDVAHCRASRAALAAVEGDTREAESLARSALTAAEDSGSRSVAALAWALSGVVALERGDGTLAEQRYRRALDDCLDAGRQHWVLDCLGGLAAAAVLLGEPARAGRLFAAVDAAYEHEGFPPEPGPERESHERRRRQLWSQGDEEMLAVATEEGARLDVDQAVRLARREDVADHRRATVIPLRARGAAAGR